MTNVTQQADRTAAEPGATTQGTNWTRDYASPQALSRAVVVLLGIVIVTDLASIGALQSRIDVVRRLQTSGLVTPVDLANADDRVRVCVLAWIAAFVLTAILFIWWFQRIYGNVTALGARNLRYGHGWSIGSWFVPIVNLLRPAHIAHDAWQASDPSLGPDRANWRAGRRGRIVSIWWGIFIVSSLVDRIAARHGSSTIGAAITADRLSMASDALDVVAALVAIVFIVQLTRRQLEARKAALAAGA